MTNVNQAPLPRLSKRRWYVLRLLSGAISSTWLYLFLAQGLVCTDFRVSFSAPWVTVVREMNPLVQKPPGLEPPCQGGSEPGGLCPSASRICISRTTVTQGAENETRKSMTRGLCDVRLSVTFPAAKLLS